MEKTNHIICKKKLLKDRSDSNSFYTEYSNLFIQGKIIANNFTLATLIPIYN